MSKRFTILCLGIFMLCVGFPMRIMGVIGKPLADVYYQVRLDTSGVFVGYLGVDPVLKTRVVVSNNAESDSTLWKIVQDNVSCASCGYNDYVFINKATKDTLAFNVPVQNDTIAAIVDGGGLKIWEDLFDWTVNDDYFKASANMGLDEYCLTYNNGIVYLSDEGTATFTKLELLIVRPKSLPDLNAFYKLKVDTTAAFVADSTFFRADTMAVLHDSLVVDSLRGDLSMWKFAVDTLINDTAYFKIFNKETSNMLAFDVPSQDTIAVVNNTGLLNLWRLPFFTEDSCVARFVVCDTATKKDYYLGLTPDSIVMLLSDTTSTKSMLFSYSENVVTPPVVVVPPVEYRFDSTQVYKIKYLSGVDSGKYMAKFFATDTVVDSVYAHMPDGQFVVNVKNTNSLINRTIASVYTDTMKYVVDTSTVAGIQKLDTIANQYVYNGDTIEVLPITYGNINTLKKDPALGYNYFIGSDMVSFCYIFKYANLDSLQNRLLGYRPDSSMTILADGDSAKFILEESNAPIYGVPAIGDIARLERHSYSLRSVEDTTLYVSIHSGIMVDAINKGNFYLKEGVKKNEYYFVLYPGYDKLLVDSTNNVIYSPIATDTIATSLFSVSSLNRPIEIVEEPDDYTYLTISDLQKGHYTLTAKDGNKLTCNYYNSAVFSEEGKSVMTRAGSYTAADFCLWIDTARGQYNPNKASFYIIKDAEDTTMFNVSGLFLHVMDSTSLPSHDSYVVKANGKEYNCFNFVGGKRFLPNAILLDATTPSIKDSVGFEGKNEDAINEYRFYLQQKSDAEPDVYYLVTENNYGGAPGTRGYLCDTIITLYGNRSEVLYGGPRERAVELTLSSGNPVANEVVKPSIVPEVVDKQLAIVGGSGQITILNATAKRATIFNIVGQQVADRMLGSDNEVITVPRGIAIVKVGNKTQKVIVR